MSITKDGLTSNQLSSSEEVKVFGDKNATKKNTQEALSAIVQLKFNKEFKGIFGQFQDVFSAMLKGDFSKRIHLPNRKNLFTYFGSVINLVQEELETNVVKTHYLESVLEFIPDMAILTDKEGKILFVNSNVTTFLNEPKEGILKLTIEQLMEFGAETQVLSEGEQLTDATIKINNFTSRVFVKERKLYNVMGEHDGYLYIAQEMLTGSYKIKNLNNRYIIR